MNINQKGITLIALVITIIVLLILAGVSIAMLTGQNGILTQASSAKVAQIEGQVKEEVNLAVQSAKMYAEQKAVITSTGYNASEHLQVTGSEPDATTDDIITEMKKDLTTDKGYTSVSGTNGTDSTAGTITIEYTSDNYTSARNKSDAKITIKVNVENNTFTIESISGSQTIDMTAE